MSKLYERYNYLKRTDTDGEHTLYLFKSGIFFIFLQEDAKIASGLLHLKITQLNSEVVKCGFPINSFQKYKSQLDNCGYQFKIIDTTENASFSITDYSVDENISDLLNKIRNVNPENLSIREAYEFIDKIKQEAIQLTSLKKDKNNS